MRNVGLGSWIARRARMGLRRTALIWGDSSWSYRELSGDVSRLAGALAGLGVRAGDRVGYVGPNHPLFLQTPFACGLLGAVCVPLNYRHAAEQLAYIIGDAGCRVVLVGDVPDDLIGAVRARAGGATFVAAHDGRSWGPALSGLLPAGVPDLPDLPVGLDDLCFLPYTSGTTGRPKGVMLTHGNVTANALNFFSVSDFRSDDVTLAIAPLYRFGGWGVTLLPTLHKGGTVVLAPPFTPEPALALVARHRVTTLFGGPDLMAGLVASPAWTETDLSSLRFVISGGDTVPEHLIRAFLDRGIAFLQGYGLTEAGPMALMLDHDDALRKLGSAGVPPLLVDVRIARADLSEVDPGEHGEILVRGANVMRGYWGRPEATEAALADGWLRTGDVGTMDDEGFLYVVDRIKDLYVSCGENVYPAEVERVLDEHPAVAEVVVVARADEQAGQVGVAFVVPAAGARPDGEELLRYCRENMAAYQVPAAAVFLGELPRSPAGKVLRSRLREMAAERPGA
jgi:fatty-acyl-CoA synthase